MFGRSGMDGVVHEKYRVFPRLAVLVNVVVLLKTLVDGTVSIRDLLVLRQSNVTLIICFAPFRVLWQA